MNGEDEGPDVIGDVEIGANNDLPTMTDVAGDDQPLQRDLERAQGVQRGEHGRFAKRETVKNPNTQSLTRDEVARSYKKALAGETDAEALDAVKPGRQDPAAKQDQRQPSKKGTLETGKADPADTTPSPELEKARAALKLDRWTDEKLAILTDEQVLKLGKAAQDEHRAKYQAGREQAAAAKNGKAPATTADMGNDDESLEFEEMAKEHFADFDDQDGAFGKSLAGFAKATHARMRSALQSEIAAIRAEALESITKMHRDLRQSVAYEAGLRELADEFPKAATPEGRKALSERVTAILSRDGDLDVRTVTREQANGLWADEIRKAGAARDQKLRAARAGGHADVQSMGEAPRKKSDWEIARDAVRQHMLG